MAHPEATSIRPTSMTTTLHIGPEHVDTTDLTDQHDPHDRVADLVSLTFGDHHAKTVVLGSLAHLRSILDAAARQLDQIDAGRTVQQ